jgi:holo-[acyl-carrier protein] synthase
MAIDRRADRASSSSLIPENRRIERPAKLGRGRNDVLRVGIDVASVADVRQALGRFGERYVTRVFTPHEASYCRAAAPELVAQRFAARFAAKEAAVKVLRPRRRWTDWSAIEIRRESTGWCELALHREAAALAARQRIEWLAVSLSHDADVAAAVVAARAGRSPGALK